MKFDIKEIYALDVVVTNNGRKGICYWAKDGLELRVVFPNVDIGIVKHSDGNAYVEIDNFVNLRIEKVLRPKRSRISSAVVGAISIDDKSFLQDAVEIYSSGAKVPIGSTVARVKDGKFNVEGFNGTIEDAAAVLKAFDDEMRPEIKAHDVLEIGERSLGVVIEGPDGLVVVSSIHNDYRWGSSYESFDCLDEMLDNWTIRSIWRWDKPLFAIQWSQIDKHRKGLTRTSAKKIWESSRPKIGDWNVVKLADGRLKIGCQTVNRDQIKTLLNALYNSISKETSDE